MLDVFRAKQKFIVVGVGKSGNIGRKLAATLTNTGAPTIVLDAVDAIHGSLGVVTKGNLVIALSYSGETDELTRLLPLLKRINIKLIAITGCSRSTLAQQADVCLSVKIPKEACPFNFAPTSSTTAMLVISDALSMLLGAAHLRKPSRGTKRRARARNLGTGAHGLDCSRIQRLRIRPKTQIFLRPPACLQASRGNAVFQSFLHPRPH